MDARLEIAADVTLSGQRHRAATLELHGGVARGWPKKSYRVRFDERVEHDFFGDGDTQVRRVVLQAAWIDPSFIRNKLVFELVRSLGGLAPRLGYAQLVINGEPQGLYQVIERIDGEYLTSQGFSKRGNLYKAEDHNANWAHHANPLAGFAERTNEDGIADDLGELFSRVSKTEASFEAFERELAPLLDFDDIFIWHWVMSYALNVDTFSKNYYLYHDPEAVTPARGSVFRVIQWDSDATFGLAWTGDHHPTPTDSWLYGARNHFAARLFELPVYRARYLEGFSQLLAQDLHPTAQWTKARALLSSLEEHIRSDLARWQRYTTFEAERDFLEVMIRLRHEVMSRSVDDALSALYKDTDDA